MINICLIYFLLFIVYESSIKQIKYTFLNQKLEQLIANDRNNL